MSHKKTRIRKQRRQLRRQKKLDKRIKLSTHHRKPTSIGGESFDYNISHLPTSKHRAWHTLFQNWTPERIAFEINERYLDTDYYFVAKRRE